MNISIKGFIDTSFIDWPGKITAVIFLPYCNFRCPFCHNFEIIQRPEDYKSIPLEDVFSRLKKLSGWVDGVCVSGGEPTINSFLPFLFDEIKNNGYLAKLDTNGSNPDLLDELIKNSLVDYVAMDIKAPLNNEIYSLCTGTNVDVLPIKRSIEILMSSSISYEFRTTMVPCFHTEEDIYEIACYIKGSSKYTIQNLKAEDVLDPDLKKVKPLTSEKISQIQSTVTGLLNPAFSPASC
ncbi:MAG: anaerobic ribonucleoside-triphosphate reductase activating protein [Thermodesulfobacteriota bacterium]|nr:anaerobic ribonucleoside-triphosphate reductase activating protein [Thermodesulfobacteriota bacterium]